MTTTHAAPWLSVTLSHGEWALLRRHIDDTLIHLCQLLAVAIDAGTEKREAFETEMTETLVLSRELGFVVDDGVDVDEPASFALARTVLDLAGRCWTEDPAAGDIWLALAGRLEAQMKALSPKHERLLELFKEMCDGR